MIITKRKILKTAFLPEYLPRIKSLFGSGFGNLALLIAIVYNTVRILPNNHPYLSPDKKGQYNIRQVIAEASRHLSFKRKNIDQIIVFFAIIAALIMLVLQFFLLALSFIIPKSFAQELPAKFSEFEHILDFFVTPDPSKDIAFSLLNLTFGIPEFFGGAATGANAVTEPIHEALHNLFNFYSYGMLIVGSFIILYMVVTTIAETAQSGTPFGRRFNKTWVPIRIVLFFALLLPITLGLNSAQYITLLSAKLGSGLASQGWLLYNETIARENYTLTGRANQNIATPKKEDLMHLPAFMTIVRTCANGYDNNRNKEFFPSSWDEGILPWAVYESTPGQWTAEDMLTTTIENLIVNSEGRDIHIVFGIRDPAIYKTHRDSIDPICGSIVFKITDASQPGSAIIRTTYYELIQSLWRSFPQYTYFDNGLITGEDRTLYWNIHAYSESFSRLALSSIYSSREVTLPDKNFKLQWDEHLNRLMETAGAPNDAASQGIIQRAVEAQIGTTADWAVPPEITTLGWAGAGVWYNKIAEKNGALISAIRNTPVPMLYPRVMEQNKKNNRAENVNANPLSQYTPSYAPESPVNFDKDYEKEIANAMSLAQQYWNEKDSGNNPNIPKTGNAFIDIVNVVLGTQGLFDMCRNTDIHPLAQLSAIGKSMLDNAIKSFGVSAFSSLLGIAPVFQQTTAAISSFFGTVASVGLMIGFVLFYVLPFMPFIYFFFAVGAWVKTIFEAMVAMPLWALAHLRIDGDGIMGDAAMNGYYLIFEIFIRPILIIFGFLASIIIFAAMVKSLNEIFYLVVTNLSGHDAQSTQECFQNPNAGELIPAAAKLAEANDSYRGSVDEFFLTIIYAITVYIIGTSCFKLIDGIPNSILRWMSAETSSFADNAGDAAEGLMKYATIGGSQFGSQLGQSLSGIGEGVKKTGQDILTVGFLE